MHHFGGFLAQTKLDIALRSGWVITYSGMKK